MNSTKYKEVVKFKYNLTPSQLSVLNIPNKNIIPVKNFLDRKLEFSDKGNEVGSANYVYKSNYYFIRAKALQEDYFLPLMSSEAVITIRPQVFKNFNLKEGDLIISKDSNIGEIVILDKNYPNFTISGALYKLPITKNKFYLFAFLKHRYFREQLDLLVPKGSTIRHAKTLFLNCKIPFSNQKNADEVIKYVELLTRSIIQKEKEIRKKNQLIFDLVEQELLKNQQGNESRNENLKFNELLSNLRFDANYHCCDYKQKQFLISNYIAGAESIEKWGFKIKRGESLAVYQIGKSIYSNEFKNNFYILIKATNFSEFGTIKKLEYLGTSKKLSFLKPGDILISSTGTVGKCVLFNEPKGNWIINYNSVILRKENYSIRESAFVSCFFRFLKHWGILDYISAGGQGGSLAKKWETILIPKFPQLKQEEISLLYHNSTKNYPRNLNIEKFLEEDQEWNSKVGVLELDKSIKSQKKHLNKILDTIINDEKVKIDFIFLNREKK